MPIILGRPFLARGRALVDMEKGQMKFRLNNEEVTFNICRSMRQSGELQSASSISYNMGETFETQSVEALAAVIMNFDSDCIEKYESLVVALDRGDVRFKSKKYELDMKNCESPPAKPSIE